MARATPDFTALNYGYVSPKLRGRVDLDFYDQALDYLQNYKVTPQGEASLREGSLFVATTKGGNIARLVPFIYETEQAYQVEMTDQFMRFYTNNGLITETGKAITAITKAANAQLTIASHGYSTGDPIYLSGIGGMHQLNGVEAEVASVVDTDNITIDINTTAYSTYTSGGLAAKIVQIATPYTEAQIFEVDYTQTENTMYMTHKSHQPRKLSRASSTSWTLATFEIISNPFGTTKESGKTITAITKADPAVVTSTAHGYSNGDTVWISGVLGMTEVNNKAFTVDSVTSNTFALKDYDSSTNTTYTSGGSAEKFSAFDWPSIVTLFEGRLIYGASDTYPTRLWFSKIREDESNDDFTTGTDDSDAIIYKLRADQANRIRWVAGAENYIALGTSGSEFRISGGGDNNAITPTNISVKPVSFNGVAKIRPIRLDSYILYPQRNKRTVRSFEYNALQDGYTSPDRTLLADHIGNGKFKEFSYTAGTPNIIWAVRNDGKMAGLTFDPEQQVVAWHLHKTQGGKFVSVSTIPDADDDDELWYVVERTINGVTRHSIEYVPVQPDIPVPEDYYTGEDNAVSDQAEYLADLWDVQKKLVHLDSALIYDGSQLATVGLSIVGDLTVGSSITVTADGSYFDSGMVTDERRFQDAKGGQFKVTAYTSATEVTAEVLYDLDSSTMASGTWAYMAKGVSGLTHLEGQTVDILSDGGVQKAAVVTNGEITLGDDAGYVIVGIPMVGIGKSEDVNGGTELGSAMTKPRAVTKLGVRMRDSLGTKFGTNLYDMEHPAWREIDEVAGRPPRLQSGVFEAQMPDGWEEEKYIYWLHDSPTPSHLQQFQPMMETNEE